MEKKDYWVEVACTTHKTVLVKVEASDEDQAFNTAVKEAADETGADEAEIIGFFEEEPSLAMYDEILEVM
jgi:hypothetical protein